MCQKGSLHEGWNLLIPLAPNPGPRLCGNQKNAVELNRLYIAVSGGDKPDAQVAMQIYRVQP
jgi:hypothetical protein